MTAVFVHGVPETAQLWDRVRAELDGVGHFWPYQAPARGAAVLRDFWASL
jgi:hypothetical protein